MGKTIAWPSMSSSRSTTSARLQRYSSGSFEPMWVWASRSSRPGTSSRMRSSQGRMPVSSTTTDEPIGVAREPGGLRGLRLGREQEVVGLVVPLHKGDGADHRHQEALGVNVAGVDVGRVDLAGEQPLHLLAVLGEVGAVHDRRPAGRLELLLGIADQVAEGLVELAE